jgi:hypothetical protein
MNSMKRATFHFFDRSMLLIMVLWLAPVSPALAALHQTPMESVRSTIEDVIRILTNEQLKQLTGVRRSNGSYEIGSAMKTWPNRRWASHG